jgi:hypothetical protein
MRRSAVLALLVFALLAPDGAQAGVLPGTCPKADLEQPFTRFLDPMRYVLAPDGGFEGAAAGWKLRGAGVERGNESYYVGGADHRRSLELAPGESAVSPAMCVGLERPTLRFFTKRTGGWLLPSTLAVEVLFNGVDGELRTVALLPVTASGSWQPTLPLPILANLLPNLSGDAAVVAFRFTALTGTTRIDDVYVDPYAKR